MSKTIRNHLLVLTGVITAATAAPAQNVTFMGENFSCESASNNVARIFEEHKVPDSAGIIPMLENLIWMLETSISTLDANCQGSDGYPQFRADLVNSLNSARQACSQMSSTGTCSARRYN